MLSFLCLSHLVSVVFVAVVPADVGWGLGQVLQDAGQVDHAAPLDVQVRCAKDTTARLCRVRSARLEITGSLVRLVMWGWGSFRVTVSIVLLVV